MRGMSEPQNHRRQDGLRLADRQKQIWLVARSRHAPAQDSPRQRREILRLEDAGCATPLLLEQVSRWEGSGCLKDSIRKHQAGRPKTISACHNPRQDEGQLRVVHCPSTWSHTDTRSADAADQCAHYGRAVCPCPMGPAHGGSDACGCGGLRKLPAGTQGFTRGSSRGAALRVSR